MGADAHMVPNLRGSPVFPAPSGRCAVLEQIIDEHHPVGNETVVSNRHQIANEAMGLNFTTIADFDSGLYFDKGTDETIVTDGAAIEVDGLHDLYPFAKNDVADGD